MSKMQYDIMSLRYLLLKKS